QVSKKNPRLYSDWRKLLAEKDLDIVLIDTPDHWHALPMIEAVKQGLDVWVQKPMPSRITSSGGIFVDPKSKANITHTQEATFEFPDVRVVWTHRSWGDTPGPRFPWGATFYGDKGTLEASVMGYAFTEAGKKEPAIKEDVVYELDTYPEDRTEKDLE